MNGLISTPSRPTMTHRYERKDPIPAWAAAIQVPRSSVTSEAWGVVPDVLRSHVDDELTSVRTSRWHDEWLRHHVVPRHCRREIGAGRGNQHHLHFGDRSRSQLLIMRPRDQLTEADLRFPILDLSEHVIGVAGSTSP